MRPHPKTTPIQNFLQRPAAYLHGVIATVLQDERVDLLDGVPQLVVCVTGWQLQLRDEAVQLRDEEAHWKSLCCRLQGIRDTYQVSASPCGAW